MDIVNYALHLTRGGIDPRDLSWIFLVGKFLRYDIPRDGLYWKYYKDSCSYLKRALNKSLVLHQGGTTSMDNLAILLSYELNHVSKGLPIVLDSIETGDRLLGFLYNKLKKIGDSDARLKPYSDDIEAPLGVLLGFHADKIEEILNKGNLERVLLINPKGNYRKLNINIVQRSKPCIPIPCLPLREEDCCRK